MRSVTQTLNTNGSGFWSHHQREVAVTGLEFIDYSECDSECDTECDTAFGELRVYFDTGTWDVSQHGLIYTDKQFLVELKDYLVRASYDISDIEYSEQGMQGDNYVSLDVGQAFITSWNRESQS